MANRYIEYIEDPTATYTVVLAAQPQTGVNIKHYGLLDIPANPTQTKTATANGTITPDSGYLLSSVTVAIPVYSDLS